MLLDILKRRAKPTDRARVDDNTVVYAIGDVHGSAEALRQLHARIAADAAQRGANRRVLVHLGDYIDRGAGVCEVLDRLVDADMPGFEVINLQGNHDAWFLHFLEDPEAGPDWLANGGDATLLSYGVSPRPDLPLAERMAAVREKLCEQVPFSHRRLLEEAPLFHREGDYLFVHAGVKPRVALEAQSAADLLWIRDEFLESRDDHGYVVVHGHTVVAEAEIHSNRIAVDTGAYATGRLSALVLQGAEKSFLTT